MSIPARIAALALALLGLCATHWRAYTAGQARQRDAQAAAQLQATQTQAANAITLANITTKAQHARTQTETRTAAVRLRTADDIDRLRIDLDAARDTVRTFAQSAAACTDNTAAADQLLRAMASDLERLAKQGADIALAADGHAADALMLKTILDAAP